MNKTEMGLSPARKVVLTLLVTGLGEGNVSSSALLLFNNASIIAPFMKTNFQTSID